jgi:hypothetical protein
MKIQLKILIALISLPCISPAQGIGVDTAREIVTPATAHDMQQKLKEFTENEKKGQADIKDTTEAGGIMIPPYSADRRLDSFQLTAWQNYYGYMTHGYKHRKSVFSWQLFSSKIIFFVVIFLVLTGIYFAWLQFMYVIRKHKGQKTVGEELHTELTASGKEIKISSPVLGVIILVISLLFFLLYLKYVYPINEIF